MKGMFLRIPEELDRQFAQVCEMEGYKKSGLILKWVRDFVSRRGVADPLKSAETFGIDLSLLRSNLRKSPTERLKAHQETCRFVNRVRGAIKSYD